MASIKIFTPNEYTLEELYPAAFQELLKDMRDRAYSKVLHTLAMNPSVPPSKVVELSKTYSLLIEYYEKGACDPEREKILQGIDKELMQILHQLAFRYSLAQQPNTLRTRTYQQLAEAYVDLLPQTLITELLRAEPELAREQIILESGLKMEEYTKQLQTLFNLIWMTPELSANDQEVLERILERSSSPFAARVMVGALYLGALQLFDPRKIETLAHIYAHNANDTVRAAALASLLLLGRWHEIELQRWYPELTTEVRQILALGEQKELAEAVATIHICYQTTKRTRYFNDYIKPKMTNLTDQIRSFFGDDVLRQMPSPDDLEPGTLDELAKIAKEGENLSNDFTQDKDLDLAYPLMVELKAFPFFHTLSHWFFPYTKWHPLLDRSNAEALESIMPYILEGQEAISNDLYSYASMNTWGQMAQQIFLQMDVTELPPTPPKAKPSFRSSLRDYLFGLYRFHHLSPQHKEFPNPFKKEAFVLDGAFTQTRVEGTERRSSLSKEQLWELYHQLNRYKDYQGASGMCRRLMLDYSERTAEVFRGLAVAALMNDNLTGALELLKAAIHQEGKSTTTVRYIAEIIYKQGDPVQAIRWLQDSAEVEDPHGELALLLTKLLNEVALYKEALQAAFKAKFLSDGKNRDILHLLTLLLIRNNRPEEALTQVNEMTDTPALLLARGIAHLALHKVEQGIQLLMEWLEAGSPGGYDLREGLVALGAVGYEPWEQCLLEDVLRNKRGKKEE